MIYMPYPKTRRKPILNSTEISVLLLMHLKNMSLTYTLKARCQGCTALQHSNKEFTCAFGLLLITTDVGGEATQPSPSHDKCYKPKTAIEHKVAANMMLLKQYS